jgi:transcriptional regulator GlxA family with amidase domain
MEQISETGTPGASDQTVKRIGFLLVPQFSPMCLFNALDVLRTANRFLGQLYFGWRVYSIDGEPVVSANGVAIAADSALTLDDNLDLLFVSAGFHPERHCDSVVLTWLRELKRHSTELGAISTGTYILAKAGIIGDRRCTIHSENVASLREDFIDLNISDGLFEIDRGLYTCAGGTSSIDMFGHIIAYDHGVKIASAVANQLQHDRVRSSTDHQSNTKKMGLRIKSKKVAEAIDIMEQNLEQPVEPAEIAEQIQITQRQLQRLFMNYTNRSPMSYYQNLRLHHSRQLLLQTTLTIIEVAVASGFVSHSHFTKCYRNTFGYPPSHERKNAM